LENVDFYNADDRVLDRIMEKLPSAYASSCEAARIANKRKEQRVELEQATEWVQEHGSARLRKALEAKLLHSAMGVYRDERLAHERPSGGWRWRPQDVELKAIVNPSEESLEALLVVRQQEGDADLWYETSTRTPVITSWFLGRMIYAPASSVWKAWHEENDSDGGAEGFS
jgi:hypothetical protein